MNRIPLRHAHLDFHNSEHIPDIGARFDRKQFQQALVLGHIQSINIFAKCHHSWSYYPTLVGRPHPNLKRDLLGEMIEACHEIDVRAPIYYTVGWSANDAKDHPEWIVRKRDGSPVTANHDVTARPEDPMPHFSWIFLCPSAGYRSHIVEQTREICSRYPVDGFWYDICHSPEPCYCEECRRGMAEMGLNVESPQDAKKYYLHKWDAFFEETGNVIRGAHPEATVFYNGVMKLESPDFTRWMTHIEIEYLPTAWGGYDRLPLRTKYFEKRRKPMIAMTTRFHGAWGEFGSCKHPAALRYEAAGMAAFGMGCSVGDQLHPSGEADLAAYAIIGEGLQYLEPLEEYIEGTESCANLGLWLSGSFDDDQGVATMLMERQVDYEIVVPDEDFSRYSAIILTGDARLDGDSAKRLRAFTEKGGGLLVLGSSGLDENGARFLIDVGARRLGSPDHEQDYLVSSGPLAEGLPQTPLLMWRAAERVEPASAEVLASIQEPYFDRTYGHFSSHQNAPNRLELAPHPAALRKGRTVYLAHRLGDIYWRYGAWVHREYFHNALRLIYGEPTFRAELPSAGRANLLHQPARRRYIAHLLYAPPHPRGRYQIIEDMPVLRDIPIRLRVPQRIVRARLAPQNKELPLAADAGAAGVAVPELRGHQAVVFEY